MKLKLSDKIITQLTKLPENGMGYQLVRVILKNGNILNHHKVLNSSLLLLEKGEDITSEDITAIELEIKK